MAFHLETLGGLRLLAADGEVVQAQRRRLALLALLAAAGERGVTRDRLVGDLWPETSEERARHGLNQLLYGIRQSLGEGAVSGTDPLRLDASVVDSDVRRFESALAAGAYRDAVASYGGPFLDGFYLPDAPQFERRVEEERGRLAAAHASALDRLAAGAEQRGDVTEAVTWRRKLAELDRLDARRAIALMRALVAAGDTSGALAHGRTYEALVKEELDAPADPAVAAFSEEIRASLATRAASRAVSPARSEMPALNGVGGDDTIGGSHGDGIRPSAVERRRRGSRLVLIGSAAAVAVAVVTFGVRWATSDRAALAAATTSPPSIAVLPLKNLGTEPGDAALADGLTEALIAMLSRAGDLRVVPSTSVFALRGQRMDVRQVADTLHVSHVLEGGVQKVGTRLRMQIRLVDARDGTTRWSETYDREMGDLFAVQDDISRSVTRELDVRLANGGRRGAAARRHTPSIEAYELYLRGMDLALMRSAAGRAQSEEYFRRAIAADSSFAAAYAGLSRALLQEGGNAPGDAKRAQEDALRAAETAVALDDSLAEAYVALGWARQRWDWAGAKVALERAIALDPRAPRAYEGLARWHMWKGQPAEQLTAARMAVEVEPLSHSAIREFALALATNGQCDEALERLRPLKALTRPARVAGVIAGQCYAAQRKWPEAIAELRWAMEGGDARTALAFLGYALARGGRADEARSILSDLLAGRKYSHGAFGIATVHAGLGNDDEAFVWLEKAVDESTVRVYLMGPMFDDLHRDPRFAGIKRRLGL